MPQDHEVVLDTFAEADPRIEDDPGRINTAIDGKALALLEERGNLANDIIVVGASTRLHVERAPSHVHQDYARARRGHTVQHGRVVAQGGDVIHDIRTRIEGGLGDR